MAPGNGASFIVPILQQAIMSKNNLRQITFAWIFRQPEQLDWFKEQLLSASAQARRRNIKINVHAFITGSASDGFKTPSENNSLLEQPSQQDLSSDEKSIKKGTSATLSIKKGDFGSVRENSVSSSSSLNTQPAINIEYGRPEVDPLVRPVVEEAWGETGILACGGTHFTGQLRNYVARLSDERGVHKGTGAQGIFLFCESYGW
jgi:hypothetical protein